MFKINFLIKSLFFSGLFSCVIQAGFFEILGCARRKPIVRASGLVVTPSGLPDSAAIAEPVEPEAVIGNSSVMSDIDITYNSGVCTVKVASNIPHDSAVELKRTLDKLTLPKRNTSGATALAYGYAAVVIAASAGLTETIFRHTTDSSYLFQPDGNLHIPTVGFCTIMLVGYAQHTKRKLIKSNIEQHLRPAIRAALEKSNSMQVAKSGKPDTSKLRRKAVSA